MVRNKRESMHPTVKAPNCPNKLCFSPPAWGSAGDISTPRKLWGRHKHTHISSCKYMC